MGHPAPYVLGKSGHKWVTPDGFLYDLSPALMDSDFRDLFGIPEYLLELYQALHPEDVTATESDLGDVTIKNVLMVNPYNDLAFTVRDKLLVMMEAQSTWSPNIVVRLLMYLAETWQAYINKDTQNPYSSKKLELPDPEFYVIYTGKKARYGETISLAEEFLESDKFLDLKATMIYGGEDGDIIDQYITFTRVLNEQIKEKGRTQEAVLETIRICKDSNVLKKYLKSREKEVLGIMMTLFSDEYLNRALIKEQQEEGALKAQKKNVQCLHAKGFSDDDIADIRRCSSLRHRSSGRRAPQTRHSRPGLPAAYSG